MKIKLPHLFLLITLLFVCIANAQKSKEEKFYVNDTTHWQLEIPLWIPGFRGQLAYGGVDSDPDNQNNRINKKTSIEFYFSGKVSARYNKFLFQLDGVTGTIGNTITFIPQNLPNEKELVYLKIQGAIPRLYGGYSVWNKTHKNFKVELIPFLGIRYVNVHLVSDVFNNDKVIDVQPNWFEPIIGLYLPVSFKRLKFETQIDWGRNNSKNSFVIISDLRYRVSKLIDVKLGWMSFKLNHDDNIKTLNLDFDIQMYGPSAGVCFIF